jgi:mono/diheme cytochrome c family protein
MLFVSGSLGVRLSPMCGAFVTGALLIVAGAAACSLAPKSVADPQSVARGKPLYLNNCAPCHGAGGEGDGPLAREYDPPPTNLVASGFRVSTRDIDVVIEIPHYSSRVIKERATTGNREMPAWNEILTEQEIDDVVAYVRHLIAAHKGS